MQIIMKASRQHNVLFPGYDQPFPSFPWKARKPTIGLLVDLAGRNSLNSIFATQGILREDKGLGRMVEITGYLWKSGLSFRT